MRSDNLEFVLQPEPDAPNYGSVPTGSNIRSELTYVSAYADSESTSSDGVWSENTSLLHGKNIYRFIIGKLCGEKDEASGCHDGERHDQRRKLTTFAGVFAPVALGIFSSLLFLRIGFLVGQAGILEAVLQIFLAYFILVVTVFSICAISTNGAVEGGGAYFMISRALGPEFGGSIGFMFFFANVLACALYISGVVEAIVENFGEQAGVFLPVGEGLPDGTKWWKYLYATIVLLMCLFVCIIGGAMFARTSAIILLIAIICTLSVIVSIFVQNKGIDVAIPKTNHLVDHGNSTEHSNLTGRYTGLLAKTFKDNLFSNYTADYNTGDMMNFASVFAVLFSSVTGIMNGANMSGELKDPSKSIPKGTLSAVAFTFTTYLIHCILIGGSCERFLLVNDYNFLPDINLWKPFVLIGICATTLSAALGNLIGASRVLEALAKDQLFWFVLKPATITTKGGNPYVAVVITWFLVQLMLLVGSLNAIAPATSVFFLLSYAATNLACLALELASAPNFRPTFRFFTWHTATLGLIGCMVMCFLISALYSSLAIISMLVLAILLHLRSVPAEWGQISQALIFHQVRKYLLMLDPRKSHVKYWRPQILLLVANPKQCCELMDFINDIKKGGLYVIGHVKLGNLDDFDKDPTLNEYPHWLGLIDHLKIKAFVELTMARSVSEGLQQLIRLSGLGGMKPNMVCMGFFDSTAPVDSLSKTRVRRRRIFGSTDPESFQHVHGSFDSIRGDNDPRALTNLEYIKLIQDSLKLQKNVCLGRHFTQLHKNTIFQSKGTLYIDVWPVNLFRPNMASYFDNTCLFMLQLACILNMVPGWKSNTRLRVFLCVNAQNDNTLQKERKLDAFLQQLRIIAKIQIVTWDLLANHLDQEQVLDDDVKNMIEYNEVPNEYVHSVNQMIISNSSRTAVTFLYLPVPPQEADKQTTYLKQLQLLSENLPPTLFVHGLHPVTSTTL